MQRPPVRVQLQENEVGLVRNDPDRCIQVKDHACPASVTGRSWAWAAGATAANAAISSAVLIGLWTGGKSLMVGLRLEIAVIGLRHLGELGGQQRPHGSCRAGVGSNAHLRTMYHQAAVTCPAATTEASQVLRHAHEHRRQEPGTRPRRGLSHPAATVQLACTLVLGCNVQSQPGRSSGLASRFNIVH